MIPGGRFGGMGGMDAGRQRVLIPRTLDSFKSRDYRYFWASMMGQFTAMNMQMVAQSWFMYSLTSSPAMLGMVNLVSAIPMLALSLYGGVIADRVQKKNVLTIGQAAMALVTLGVALAISFDVMSWAYLLVASFFNGVIWALIGPSRQAIIPELVGEERMMNAVALNMAGMNMNRLLAPAVAGFIIAQAGVGGVYYTMAALYVVSTILIFPMSRTSATSIQGGGALARMADGLRYVRDNPAVLTVLVVTLGSVALSMPYMSLMPVFTEDILKVGPKGLGVLFSVSGAGALAGSLAIATLASSRRGLLYIYSMAILGIALIAFSFSSWYTFSLIAVVPVGLGQSGRMALSNILIQAYTEDAYRGRVMSLYMMEFGLTSFGTFGVSVLAQFIGVQWAVGGTAVLLVAMAFYCFAFVPRLRQLD